MKRLLLAAATALLWLCPNAPATGQMNGTGPVSLFITYRAAASQRAAFYRHLQGNGLEQFDHWKHDGILKDYLLLYNTVVDTGEGTWDVMAVLDFERYTDLDRWKEVEKHYPGGLSAEGLQLAMPMNTYPADLFRSGGLPVAREKRRGSVFMVKPYGYDDRSIYQAYADAYVTPQFDGWLAEGVLTSYGIYLTHHATGKPWDIMVILEYDGTEGAGQRDEVKDRVRKQLAETDPAWALIHAMKGEFRGSDNPRLVAEPILPR